MPRNKAHKISIQARRHNSLPELAAGDNPNDPDDIGLDSVAAGATLTLLIT